ncbi:MAG: hypothetical protein OHK0029_07940 [Armatimonadaceae bacterium]
MPGNLTAMKAMVLAAGEGTRLRPLTLSLPKPMVPIVHQPLLVRTLRLLANQGIREVAVNLYHRPEAIRETLSDGNALGVALHYSPEPQLMGTAGGVKRMEAFLDETFLILYGDNLYHADFAPLLAFHRERKALATIATFTAPNPSACGLILTEPDGTITRFQEKPPPEEVFTDQANAGVYILEPEVFAFIPPDTVFDFGRDVFPAILAERPGSLFALPLDGYLQDTGTLPAYRQANRDVLAGRVGAAEEGVHPTAQIASSAVLRGANVIGAGSVIGDGAVVTDSILWENVTVGDGAQVTGAILGNGVSVDAGVVLDEGTVRIRDG